MPDDDKKIDALRKLLSEGKSQTAAAKELGISRSSVIRMMKTIKQTATSNKEITAIHLLKSVENATILHLSFKNFTTHLEPSKPVFFNHQGHLVNFIQNHDDYWISTEFKHGGIFNHAETKYDANTWISEEPYYFLFETTGTGLHDIGEIIGYLNQSVNRTTKDLIVKWNCGNDWKEVLSHMHGPGGQKQVEDLANLAGGQYAINYLTPIVQKMIMESKHPVHDLIKMRMTDTNIRDLLKSAWATKNKLLHVYSDPNHYQQIIWDDLDPQDVFERFLEDGCGVPKKYVKKMIDLGRYNLKELKIAIEGGFKDPKDLEAALSGGFMNLRTLTKARRLKCLTNDELEDVVNNGWQDGEKMRQALHLGFGPGDQERYGVLKSLNHIDWFNDTAMFKWANSQPISVLKKLKKFPSPRAYEMAKFIDTINEPMYRTDKLQLEFNKLPAPGEAFPSNQEQQFEQFLRNDCFTGLLDVGSGGIVTILKKKTKKIPTVPEPKKRKG